MPKVPRGERIIIAVVGMRNAGKSSLINAITSQVVAIVSDIAGTTTDPVQKSYELLPLGPVSIYDTAGLDDTGVLGDMRMQATHKVLWRADIALVVVGENGLTPPIKKLIKHIKSLDIPLLIIFNKSDLSTPKNTELEYLAVHGITCIMVSALHNHNINELKRRIAQLVPPELKAEKVLAGDLVKAGETCILVVPIDLAAPKGRLILPQVQVIRELLDNDALAVVAKERELAQAIDNLSTPPALVITDSQVVLKADADVPEHIPLTTFSILFARYKGDLAILAHGAKAIDTLTSNSRVLIAESCSHHVQADDIGRVKIPRWIRQYTGVDFDLDVYAGHDFPTNLEDYDLVIHCGGCMANNVEMLRRIRECHRRGVPITNYGVAISKTQGVLERVLAPFELD